MSEKIKTAGKHFVQIASTRWEEMQGKNGAPNYPVLILEGMNAEQHTIEGRIFFSNVICQGGKFQGKTRMEESMAKCIELGMKEPFNPANTGPFPYDANADQLHGVTCEFVVEIDDKYGPQVKYINVQKREPIAASRVNEMFKAFAGVAPTPATPKQDVNDDLPL